jgi:uncharacterized short protein YbdD (DUF466 family)
MQNPDDPLATETIEHRRRIEAADARFRARGARKCCKVVLGAMSA